MPGQKKNIEQLKLEGTYRKDRHANRDESAISALMTIVPDCPSGIEHQNARDAWDIIIPQLVSTRRVAQEDIPELELAFRALSDVYKMRELENNFVGFDKTTKEYARIVSIITRREQRFLDIIGLYGISSQKRLTLLGQMLDGQKKKSLADRMTK